MIKRYSVLLPIFFVFLVFSLQLRWTDVDNQAFNKISLVDRYGGEIIPRDVGAILLTAFAFLFIRDLYKSVKLLPPSFYVACILPFLSVIWTIDVERTVNGLIVLSLTIVYVLIAVRLFGGERTVRIFWIFSMGLIFFSTILALAGDNHVLMASTHDGQWRGLFNHKNVYSPFVVVIMLMTIFGEHILPPGRLLRYGSLALCAMSLIQAGSSTGIAALMLSIGAGLLASMPIKRRLNRGFVYVVTAALSIFVVFVLLSEIETVTAALDRDITLTGRTSLWAAAAPFANQTPFGYGFATSGGDQIIDAMRRQSGWLYATSTHSVYISRALDVGWFGMALMVLWTLPYLMVPQRTDQFKTRRMLASIVALYYIGGITEVAGLFYPSASFIAILMLVSTIREPVSALDHQRADESRTLAGRRSRASAVTAARAS